MSGHADSVRTERDATVVDLMVGQLQSTCRQAVKRMYAGGRNRIQKGARRSSVLVE